MSLMLETLVKAILQISGGMGAIYAIFFVLAIAMKTWRSLLSVGLVVGALIGWGLFEVLTSTDTDGGGAGFGLAIAHVVFLSSGFGLLAGVLAGAIGLVLRQVGKPKYIRVTVGLVAFLIMPSYVVANVTAREWSRRLPTKACSESEFQIELAGERLRVPADPLIVLYLTDEGKVFDFNSNSKLRALCASTIEKNQPLHATGLSMNIDRLRYTSDPRFELFCEPPSSIWAKDLCGRKFGSTPHPIPQQAYPTGAALYSPKDLERSGHRYSMRYDTSARSYRLFLDERAKAASEGNPLNSKPAGIFQHYSNDYWVARPGTWITDGGDPFTLHCYEQTYNQTLYCKTAYDIASGARLSYRFLAPVSDLETTAKAVDRNLRAMISELSSPN